MTSLEYSDRHKFLSSIGIALIVVAFLLPWFFLRESFDLLLTCENIEKLTSLAQHIIHLRQERISLYTRYLPYISLVLLLSGLFLLIYGLISWSKIQNVKDQIEEANLKKLKDQAHEMNEREIQLKSIKELEKIQEADSGKVSNQEDAKTKAFKINGAIKFVEVEKKFIKVLKEKNLKEYEVLSNRIIGNRSFDAILANKQGMADILIEIKYFSKTPSVSSIHGIHDRQLSVQKTYEETTRRTSIGFIFIVLENDIHISESFIDKVKEMDRDKKQITVFLKERDIDQVDINKIFLDYVFS